jgi:hypothetical protein
MTTITFTVGEKVRIGLGKTIWTVTDARDLRASNPARFAHLPDSPRRWYLTLKVDGQGRSKFVYGSEVTKLTDAAVTHMQAEIARESDAPKGECQICARRIGVKAGVIAHHGYRRPWHRSGVQTASCTGARALPYEISRDLLTEEIHLLKETIAQREARIAKQHAEHPPLVKAEAHRNRKTNEWVEAVMLAKGEDVATYPAAGPYPAYSIDRYDALEEAWLRQAGWDLKAYRDTLKTQEARWATWKPAQGEAA